MIPVIPVRNIKTVSHAPQERLTSLYSAATVTFYPAEFDAFRYVVLESLASGTPVVTTPDWGPSGHEAETLPPSTTADSGTVTSLSPTVYRPGYGVVN